MKNARIQKKKYVMPTTARGCVWCLCPVLPLKALQMFMICILPPEVTMSMDHAAT